MTKPAPIFPSPMRNWRDPSREVTTMSLTGIIVLILIVLLILALIGYIR